MTKLMITGLVAAALFAPSALAQQVPAPQPAPPQLGSLIPKYTITGAVKDASAKPAGEDETDKAIPELGVTFEAKAATAAPTPKKP